METPQVSSSLVYFHIVMGPLILLIAILYKAFPPSKINYWYGYRTPLSMKSQEIWDEANRYSARMMIYSGLVTVLFQIIAFLTVTLERSVIYTAIFMVVLLILNIPFTQMHLKANFDHDGKPIEDKL